MSACDSRKSGYIDTLRLSARDEEELLAKLDGGRAAALPDERRIDKRLNYHREAGLIVQMRHLGGTVCTYLVKSRNLSTTGIGFLHGAFVYPGTRCSIALITINNKIVRAEGEVVRCRLVTRHVHEVGLRFTCPIRLWDFVGGRPVAAGDDHRGQMPQLGGHILYVEDSISEQELLKYHLRKLGIKAQTAPNGVAALDLASHTKFDAVMMEMSLPVMPGTEVARCLRDVGYAGPIIMVTADDRPAVLDEAMAAGATCVLSKPFSMEQLLEMLSKHLPKHGATDEEPTIMSELWGDSQIRPLICAFLKTLGAELAQVKRLVEKGKRDALVQKMCMDVKGSAGGYGYPQISTVAGELLQMAISGAPLKLMKERVDSLCEMWDSAQRGVESGGTAGRAAAA